MTSPAVTVELVTDPDRAAAVAEVAGATFPLACPPHAAAEDIAEFIATNLGEKNFRGYITDPDADVLVARDGEDGAILGYALVLHGDPSDPVVAAVVPDRPATEVSKMYVLPDHHSRPGLSPSRGLMNAALDRARDRGSAVVWLGVNQLNERAQKFYTKTGFSRAGVRTFDLGGSVEHDYVFTQKL
ncbi:MULTISPECIES: GNAT family N-acetyltransferase [Gordonia]|uniref:GNAT family N-acetyltransferase n=1 Tax=Gordonia amicalis TaxID=89053 RepID=A0AAE4U3W2_9ACTN|nr:MULTISPECIES: GNAT family N-acetyltransferase [Gordonia]KAF0970811.1 putative N-acetyltransferase [Gordonia sp. YY1]MCZ0913369.1 GNAT family N-acetyltransferase [Gordonia amicalis]MCZ4577751.1 GNAT family N-acetyltransferase [Gordonia amicalis]MCZ4651381.1 GNAT family N-acetyltransferase [Gordonia amicalis]MDJ0451254.1 GNAT family N-acetyltransferase [Gordonia amicalis]